MEEIKQLDVKVLEYYNGRRNAIENGNFPISHVVANCLGITIDELEKSLIRLVLRRPSKVEVVEFYKDPNSNVYRVIP